jgi:hypothetical protein
MYTLWCARVSKLHTLLIDPDEGKKLKPEVKQQLLDSLIIAHSKLPIHLAVL